MSINLVDFVKDNVFSSFNSDNFSKDKLTKENALKLIKLSILINGKGEIKELPEEIKKQIKVKTLDGELVNLDNSIWINHGDFDVMPTVELDMGEKYFNDLLEIITYSAEGCDGIREELKPYKAKFEDKFSHADILDVRNIIEELNSGILDFFEGNTGCLEEIIDSVGDADLCDFVDTDNPYITTIFSELSDQSKRDINKYAEQINYLSQLLNYR